MKKAHDELQKNLRERDNLLKTVRSMEATVNNIKSMSPSIQRHSDEIKRQKETLQREFKAEEKTCTNMRKEIDLTIYDLLKKENAQGDKLEEYIQLNSRKQIMEEELEILVRNSEALDKKYDQLGMDKEIKARDLIRTQVMLRKIQEEIRAKDMIIFESNKRYNEATNQLKEYALLYDVVKNERNKFVDFISCLGKFNSNNWTAIGRNERKD